MKTAINTSKDKPVDHIAADEMRRRRITLADGRYLIFYEFKRPDRPDSAIDKEKSETLKTVPEEASV